MFDPTEAPALGLSSEAYHNHKGSSLHHFFEKLFTLKDLMNTEAAKVIAEQRERFLWDFVIEFYTVGMIISTRRFCCLPSAVSLVATGRLSP